LRHIGEYMGVETPKDADAVKDISLPDDKYAYCKVYELPIVEERGNATQEDWISQHRWIFEHLPSAKRGAHSCWYDNRVHNWADPREYDWAETDYCVKGPDETLDQFCEFMGKFPEGGEYYLQLLALTTELGKSLGLGGGYLYHVGFWRHLRRTKHGVEFTLWSLLGPIYGQVNLLKLKFPSLRFLFRCQDDHEWRHRHDGVGCITNDVNGERFHERWATSCGRYCGKYLSNFRTDRQLFMNEEDALRHIGEFMGVATPKDAQAVKKICKPASPGSCIKEPFCRLNQVVLVNDFGERVAKRKKTAPLS